MVGPTFNVGIAQHHMAFTGTITLRPLDHDRGDASTGRTSLVAARLRTISTG